MMQIADGMIGRWEAFLDIVFGLLAMNFTAAFYFLQDWSCLGDGSDIMGGMVVEH